MAKAPDPSNDPEVTAVLDDLRRIVQALRTASRDSERRLGVTGAQLFVLKALLEAQVLSLNELAQRTRTHQSTVSVVVKRLVERGLIARSASKTDGRSIALALTSRGRTLLARAPHSAQDQLIEGVSALTVAQRRGLAAGLRRVAEAMHAHETEPTMFFEDAPPHRRRAQRKRGILGSGAGSLR